MSAGGFVATMTQRLERGCSRGWEDASGMASTFPWGDLPIALGELLRSGLSGVVEDVIDAVRAEVPEYDQPLEGEFGMLISQGVSVALEQFVGLLGRDEDVPDLADVRGSGSCRAPGWAYARCAAVGVSSRRAGSVASDGAGGR